MDLQLPDDPSRDPRVARSMVRIMQAAIARLSEHGWAGTSIEAIAADAGVGKATIYRHFGSLANVILESFVCAKTSHDVPEVGEVEADMVAHYGALATSLSSGGLGRMLLALLAAADQDPELSRLHQDFLRERRARSVGLVERAMARGELRADLDPDIVVDLIAAPLFYRRLVARQEVSPAYAAEIVRLALPALRPTV